jgi:DNA polymerase III sliding clamp (beta) subunit (PCNA family)
MKPITLPVSELKPALAGFGKIVGKRTTLPVLGMLKLDRTTDGWITITATDLDTFVTVRLEQPTEGEPASILVSHEDLNRITKRCGKDESLQVEKEKGDKAVIQFPIGNQTAAEHLASLPVEEFPPVPKIKSMPMSINNEIRQSLLEALSCASTDETRLILNGAFFDVSDQKCQQIIGTDGRHLYSSNSFALPLKNSILVPSHRFLEWKEFNDDGEWQLRVQEPEKKDEQGRLQISSRRWRFITRQIEGNYPNWKQVVPKPDEFKTTVQLSQEAIESAIKLIPKIPCHDDANHTIGLKVDGQKLFLRGRSESESKPIDFEIEGITVKGNPVTVHLNRNFLSPALKLGMGEIQIIDPMSPLRFANYGKQIIIMPIRPDSQTQPIAAKPAATAPASTPASEPTENSGADQSAKERSTMPKTSKNGSGTNGHQSNGNGTESKPALDAAVEQIEGIKTSLRTTRDGLNQLLDTIKQAQREHKSTDKEVQSVRSTLEKLQSVRI